MDGLGTEIYMSGLGIETAEHISKRIGRRRRRDKREKSIYGEINLLNPDEIINMEDDEVLMLHSNKRPIRYRVTPFFRQWWMKRASEKSLP
jgi:type IV secretory pathway TraG/TraD family ATPase VirD4